jgi:hypothetical protein
VIGCVVGAEKEQNKDGKQERYDFPVVRTFAGRAVEIIDDGLVLLGSHDSGIAQNLVR